MSLCAPPLGSTMNPKIAFLCLVFWTMVPNILASSCELIVRIADLQDIIKNQTKAAEAQTQVIKDQKQMLKNQADAIGDLKELIENLKTGKCLHVMYFWVFFYFH